MNKEYAQGFMDKCAELGVDAEKLAQLMQGLQQGAMAGMGRQLGAQLGGQLAAPKMPAPGAQQFANAPWRRNQQPGMRPSAVGAMQNLSMPGNIQMQDQQGQLIGQGSIGRGGVPKMPFSMSAKAI